MKNGKIMMTLNTGWYLEEDNDIFIEMMLSEQIWIRVQRASLGIGWLPKTSSSFIIPVNLTSQQMQVKNKLNDKMINYTFEFEAAADRINTVR
jgi:ubiquinone biosynthesis protein COQ9